MLRGRLFSVSIIAVSCCALLVGYAQQIPTWGECRLRHLDGSLTEEMRLTCDALYGVRAPADKDGITHRYGIKWVVMTDLPSETYLDDNLRVMNQMYNPAGVAWQTEAVQDLSGQSLVVNTGDNDEGGRYTLEELSGDLAAHLDMAGTPSSQETLDELHRKLVRKGVNRDVVSALTADTQYRPKGFLQLIARTRPELFHVFVVPIGGNAGTRSFYALDAAGTNIGVLRAEPFDQIPIVLAHEVGHFFGMKHSHGKANPLQVDELAFDPSQLAAKWGDGGAFNALSTAGFGANLDAPLEDLETFLPYNASPGEAGAFTNFMDALVDVYLLPDHLYVKQQPSGTFANLGGAVSPLRDLRDRLSAASTMYWKVFGKKFSDQSRITNCNHDPDDFDLPITCVYGGISVSGDEPLLADKVMADEGRRSDLMSYVVPLDAAGEPAWSAGDPQKVFTSRQLEFIRVYANAPWMNGYRNFALPPARGTVIWVH